MTKSYFEIGGQIVETFVEGPQYSQGPPAQKAADRVMLKKAHKEVIAALDEAVGDRYDVKRGIKGGHKALGGKRMVVRGLTIAAVLAAADGPLPFGDVAAAAFLIGGGTYMVYSGTKDIIQK